MTRRRLILLFAALAMCPLATVVRRDDPFDVGYRAGLKLRGRLAAACDVARGRAAVEAYRRELLKLQKVLEGVSEAANKAAAAVKAGK